MRLSYRHLYFLSLALGYASAQQDQAPFPTDVVAGNTTTSAVGPFCTPFQNPHNGEKGESYCTCNNQQAYSMYCNGKCPWASDPPTAYLVPAEGPTPAPGDCMRTDLPTEGPPEGTTYFGTSPQAGPTETGTATETQPTDEQTEEPTAESTDGQQTTDSADQPTEGQPTEGEPTEGQPTETPPPEGQPTETGGDSVTTDAPPVTASSTVTEAPTGFSTAKETQASWTTNTQVSTTDSNGQPTEVPVLVGCGECGGDGGGIVLWGLGGGGGGGGGGGTLFQLPGLPSFTIGGGGGGGGGNTPNTENQPENPRESESPSQSNENTATQTDEATTEQQTTEQQTTTEEPTSTEEQTSTATRSETASESSEPTDDSCPTKRSVYRRHIAGRGVVTFIELDSPSGLDKREEVSQKADPLAEALKMVGSGEDIESSAKKLIRNKFEPKEWNLKPEQVNAYQNAFITGLEGEFTSSKRFNGQTYSKGFNWKVRWDWEPADNPNAVNGQSKGAHINLQVDDLAKQIPSQRFGISFTGQPKTADYYYERVFKQGTDVEWDWKTKTYTGVNAIPDDKKEQFTRDEEAQAVKTIAQQYRRAREALGNGC